MNSLIKLPDKSHTTEDILWSKQAVQNSLLIGGRYLLANGEEYPCKFRCVTINRGEIIAPNIGNPGEIVICYLDKIGIVIGVIDGIISGGISVVFKINQVRHSRILARLEWHAARELEHIEMRNAARIVPVHKNVSIKTNEGSVLSGEIIDISLSGASISLFSKKRPSIGQTVTVGSRKSRVVRLISDGIAVQFEIAFKAEDFSPNIVL